MTIAEYIDKHGAVGIGVRGAHVELIQRALLADGRELVPDGRFGAITEQAVKRTQADHQLSTTGYVGIKTARALDAALAAHLAAGPAPIALPSVLAAAPQLATMRAITGEREIPGARSNPLITVEMVNTIAMVFPEMGSYARTFTNDDIAWCGHGLAYCLAKNGYRPPFGPEATQRYIYAKSWQPGPDLILLRPPYPQGAILVYGRVGGGHVALLEESGDGFDNIRGGNQSNMVSVVAKSREQLIAVTWPRMLPLPQVPAPRARVRGKVSGSEA